MDVIEAASGLEAIEQLAVAPVKLMVLDLNMPDMHGLEVLGFVRANQKFQQHPGHRADDARRRRSRAAAMQAGATRYLTKPFTPQALLTEARERARVAPFRVRDERLPRQLPRRLLRRGRGASRGHPPRAAHRSSSRSASRDRMRRISRSCFAASIRSRALPAWSTIAKPKRWRTSSKATCARFAKAKRC